MIIDFNGTTYVGMYAIPMIYIGLGPWLHFFTLLPTSAVLTTHSNCNNNAPSIRITAMFLDIVVYIHSNIFKRGQNDSFLKVHIWTLYDVTCQIQQKKGNCCRGSIYWSSTVGWGYWVDVYFVDFLLTVCNPIADKTMRKPAELIWFCTPYIFILWRPCRPYNKYILS